MDPIKKLAIVVNEQKNGAAGLARELGELAEKASVEVVVTKQFPLADGSFEGCDACCVIGGDGTLLSVVHEAAREQIPVIGVNRGSLGFLTTFTAEEAKSQFNDLLAGKFKISWRSLLSGQTGPDECGLALNDILVKDSVNSRIVHLEVYANEELVTDYFCDGLIFSTPTGSTAYNLSAGGPLVNPDAPVIMMTPICPHTLTNRTITFSDSVKLKVKNCRSDSELLVALDGQRNLVSTKASPIEIDLAPLRIPLAQKLDHSHYEVLRAKLNWSGGFVERPRNQ